MGCATSKQPVCRNCQAPYSPAPRSYSMHVHHPPEREGDTYHLVALTSTTLGSLKLDSINHNHSLNEKNHQIEHDDHMINGFDEKIHGERTKEFSMGLIEAKTWSNMINEKITKVGPKTPIRTPPGEPETINTWELMEGLEDTSPLRPTHHLRSFSFHVAPNPILSPLDSPKVKLQENGDASLKSLWVEIDSNSNSNSNGGSIITEFDPDVISTFRKALEELPPANPFHLKPLGNEKQALDGNDTLLDNIDGKNLNGVIAAYKCPPSGKDKLVLYFTSLRGVRKTYEDCCHVRVILKGLGVRVDERDVSMHSGFKEELKELSGGGLPRVFIGKSYIGGADEIRRMHEEGKLEKVVEGCEMAEDGGGGGGIGGGGVCEACGDIRFLPCETCSGSCKVYYEDDYNEDFDENEYGFQRCPDCNENGLIRCPICCD